MDYFFEKPNMLTIIDSNITIIETLDYEFDEDFVLDQNGYNMLQKLLPNAKIKITDKQVVIESEKGNYKCNKIDKVKPKITIDDVIYTNEYNVEELKLASKFASNNQSRPILCGIILSDDGGIYASDSFKLYYHNTDKKPTRFWSVPLNFIKQLYGNKITINFYDNKVVANLDNKCIISQIYDGTAPDFWDLLLRLNNLPTQATLEFNKQPLLTLEDSEKSRVRICKWCIAI